MPLQTSGLPDVFRRAAAVIQTQGHNRGGYVAAAGTPDARGVYHLDPDEAALRPVDVVGAIRIACGLEPTDETSTAADLAIEFAGEHMPGRAPLSTGERPDFVEELAQWNDFGVKAASEVVGRLLRWSGEAAAAAARQQVAA